MYFIPLGLLCFVHYNSVFTALIFPHIHPGDVLHLFDTILCDEMIEKDNVYQEMFTFERFLAILSLCNTSLRNSMYSENVDDMMIILSK